MKDISKPVRILLGVLAVIILTTVVGLISGTLPSLGEWKSLLSPLAPPPSERTAQGLQTPPLGTPVPLPEKQATSQLAATVRSTVPPPDGWPTDVPWPPPTPTPPMPQATPTRPPSLAPLGSPPTDQQALYYVADNAGYSELHAVGMDTQGSRQSEFQVVDDAVLVEGTNLVGLFPSPNGKYLALEFLGDGYAEVKIMEQSSGQAWCPLLDAPKGCWGGFSGWISDNHFLFQPFDVPPQGVISLGIIVVDITTGQYHPLNLPVSPDGVYSLARNVSPNSDGSRIAYSITDSKDGELISEIWTMRVNNAEKKLVQRVDGLITALAWSPIGEQLIHVYQSDPGQNKSSELWLVHTNGGDAKLLATDLVGDELGFRPVWSPNGRYVAFVQLDQPVTFDGTYIILAWSNVCVVDTVTGQITRLSSFERREANYPTWSPDDRFVAFVSTGKSREETLYSEVWIAAADGSQLYRISETAKWNNALVWLPPLSSQKGADR